MDVTLWIHHLDSVGVSHLRIESEGPWTVVSGEVKEARLAIHVDGRYPQTIERGRAFVAALTAALDAVEAAANPVPIGWLSPDCVPIESLAPDPVHAADLAPTVLEEDFWDRATRSLEPPEAA